MRTLSARKFAFPFVILGTMFVPLLHATPALSASAYVSATGSGATCTQAAPCATLDAAITAAGAGGSIRIVSPGDFQGPTNPITFSLSIVATEIGTVIKQDTLAQPVFTINAGANDTVSFKGILIAGGATGTIGIQVDNAGRVYILNCTLKGFTNGAAQAMFLQPNPGAGNQSQLYISNTEVSNANSGLILVAPRSGSVKTYFTHVEVHNTSGFGIKSDGTNGTVDNAITDSAFFSMTGSAIHGFTPAAASPGVTVVRVSIERTTVLNSGGGAIIGNGGGSRMLVNKSSVMAHASGISAINGGTVVLNDSVVTGNGVGVSLVAGSPVFSYANNVIQFNGFAQCGNDVCNGASPGTLTSAALR